MKVAPESMKMPNVPNFSVFLRMTEGPIFISPTPFKLYKFLCGEKVVFTESEFI